MEFAHRLIGQSLTNSGVDIDKELTMLDAQMEKEGLITFIRDTSDVTKINLARSTQKPDTANGLTDKVESFVIGQIDEFLS